MKYKQLTTILLILLIAAISLSAIKLIFSIKQKKHGDDINDKFLYKIIRLIVIVIGVLLCLYQIDAIQPTVKTILTSSGIIALAISLAAQESLTNLIDGFFISTFKPFNIGDRITLTEKNITGVVTGINLRHTTITTYQNTSYVISNSIMSNCIVENTSANTNFSYPIDVTVSYESDLRLAMKLMAEVVADSQYFYDARTEDGIKNGTPAVIVFVRDFGENGIALRCQMTVEDVHDSFIACSEVRLNLKDEFDKNGISIPYHTVTIK